MSYLTKFSTLFFTVKYLKLIQVYGRGLLYVRKLFPIKSNWNQILRLNRQHLELSPSIQFSNSNVKNSFVFLNRVKDFGSDIDWCFLEFGRLWTYNLNYFEYLDQEGLNIDERKRIIDDFISQLPHNQIGLEPYPLSLRCLNWTRFFIHHNIENPKYDSVLFTQLELLEHKIEYHLLGNHLLENGFALLFGSYYFNNMGFYCKAKKILMQELHEQILPDGAHFELSPMYHSTMLFRILDCYNLISNNNLFNKELKEPFSTKIEQMLGWLNNISFKNGNIPLMNDAAFRIAPTPKQLNDYALRLGLDVNKQINLKESGYRKFSTTKFELVADIGAIGPDYQPGHAHADTFSFELHINGRPVIVDTGTSTYELNETRFYERSTFAHNTVVVNNMNSSQVWGGHRVAKRAKVQLIKDLPDLISASHNGYQSLGQTHTRTFRISSTDIRINDEITQRGVYYLHFHPDEEFRVCDQTIVGKDYSISFSGADSIECFDSEYSPEFNKRISSKSIRITFKNRLETHFK